jgi:Uri superfamily endonuclease
MREPGIYVLLLRVPAPLRLSIGRLGEFDFPAGDYVYVGSAKGGLEGRLRRHFHTRRFGQEKLRWHIDYLLAHCDLLGMLDSSDGHGECDMSRIWARLASAAVAPGFGSSDCRCETHLHYLGEDALRAFTSGGRG